MQNVAVCRGIFANRGFEPGVYNKTRCAIRKISYGDKKMHTEQSVKHDSSLKTDYLAWRVLNAKKRKNEITRNREYNMRPRLRSETHH